MPVPCILIPVQRKTLVADTLSILISLTVVLLMVRLNPVQGGSYLNVQGTEGTYRYPLSVDRIIDVHGPLGETTVVIKDGKAFITDSPCETKACTRMAPVTKNGGFVACLPNGVLLSVASSGESEVDDVTN